MCFFAWHNYERNVQPLFAHSLYKFKHIRVVMTTQISVLLTFLSSASWWDRQRLSFHSGPEAVTLEHIDWLFDPILPPPPPRPTPLRPPSLSARTWRAYKFRQKRGSNNTTVQYVPKPVPYTWPPLPWQKTGTGLFVLRRCFRCISCRGFTGSDSCVSALIL
jgi:hypothetical protein